MHIPRISLSELLARDLDDLVVERAVLELMVHTRVRPRDSIRERLEAGPVDGCLEGEPVGTIIYRDDREAGRPTQ